MKFTDLRVRQVSRSFVKDIYDFFGNLTDYGFRDQICKAALSIMNNVAEGQNRSSDNQLKHFLSIALGSVYEVRSMLYVGLDLGYINQDRFDSLTDQANHITVMLAKFKQTIKSQKHSSIEA